MRAHLVRGRTALIPVKAITWSKPARAINVHSDWSHPPPIPVRKRLQLRAAGVAAATAAPVWYRGFHPFALQCLNFWSWSSTNHGRWQVDNWHVANWMVSNGHRSAVVPSKFSQHGSWTDSMGLYKAGGEAGSDSPTWLQMTRLRRQQRLSGKIISRDLSRTVVCLKTSAHIWTTSVRPICDTAMPSKGHSCCSRPLVSCSYIHQTQNNVIYQENCLPIGGLGLTITSSWQETLKKNK